MGLHRQLGMDPPKDFTAFFGGKENVLKEMYTRARILGGRCAARVLLELTQEAGIEGVELFCE